MHRLFTTLRARAQTRAMRGTIFCDECGQVCSPVCRQETLRDHYQTAAQRAGLIYR